MGSRSRLWLVVVLVAMAAWSSPMQETISAQSGGIMISEFRFSAPTFSSDEYIELFNSSFTSIDISGWWLKASDNRSVVADRAQFPANTVLGPGCYFLIGGPNYSLGSTATPDVRYLPGATQIFDDGSIAVFKADKTTIVDQVGFRTAQTSSAFFETERILQTLLPTPGRIYERRPNIFTGFQDTDHNVNDFVLKAAPGPQNKTGPCLQFTTYTPHEIQGAGAVSPLSGSVRVKGVVTAQKSDGFFIQTETGFEDADPNTSEGLFVSANGASLAAAGVGHLVRVIGGIEEFVPSSEPFSPPFTRIANVVMVDDLGPGSVPPAYPLTSAELSPAGSLAQLERFEGMRVMASSLTAVSGSDDDGAFFAVLTGQMRPFREPGVHAGYPVLPCALPPCHVPVFDGNPERLRVDSDGLDARARVLVSTGALLTDVTGPLDFSAGNYTLLPESGSVAGGMSIVPADGAGANAFTVATLNLGALNPARLAKASLAVRDVLHSPDVIGVQGVDALGTLTDLAAQINSDAGTTLYDAYPGDNAADSRGLGFLLKAGRASPLGQHEIISDRRSMALRVRVQGPSTSLPQDVTVVVNQLESLTDIELNDATGAAVRARRRAQAEAVANYLQNRQSSNPSEAIIALGDFNAFDFNDGYVDVVGIVRGVAAPPDQVVLAASTVVAPPFVNADALNAAAERYTSLSNGNARSLDHVLVSASLISTGQLLQLQHARVNADFPDALRADDTTPARFSDRDPLVLDVAFPADTTPPVFDVPPQDLSVEATNSDGAVATFSTPTAHDNLDPVVTVSCDPVSGSTFPLGNTGVTCSTQDVAGNQSSISFTVTVQDTTAPVVSVPDDQVAEATSADGAVVTFSATATDTVTSPLSVACSPASGSAFALGATVVTCSTEDAAHNPASASFNVTVRDTTAPVVSVPPNQVAEAASAAGAVVTFGASATDAVTSPLSVACLPLSGSTFALGTTLVTCSTEDAAHNPASASFTVTVQDTSAPVLLLPDHITEQATSAEGRVVSYVASAADLVTAAPTLSCTPASDSNFPVGDTEVSCSASDAAGNTATGSFIVTITPPTTTSLVGRMAGAGKVVTGRKDTWFAFDVRGSATTVQRGSVGLMVRDGNGRPSRFLATSISDLLFTNSEGYEPGRFPRSGIDTVSFKGVGDWNGQSGYRVEVSASDRGEPGRNLDTFTVQVFTPNGTVVESASGTLRDGNIQSLR